MATDVCPPLSERLYQSRLDILQSELDRLPRELPSGAAPATPEAARALAEYQAEVRELVEWTLEFPGVVERLYRSAWDRLKAGGRDFVREGEALFQKWDAGIKIARDARDVVAEEGVARGVISPEELERLDAMIERVTCERQKAYDCWPWFRKEDEEAALAEHARGASVPHEEVLRELQDRLARGRQG